jgi:AcrR family transcriptional regulator
VPRNTKRRARTKSRDLARECFTFKGFENETVWSFD